MQVAIYACYYTGKRAERMNQPSIEEQLQTCREYADRNGYTIVGEYIDRTCLKKKYENINRPQYYEMTRANKERQYEGILIYSFGRISEDSIKYVWYKQDMAKRGISVFQTRPKH